MADRQAAVAVEEGEGAGRSGTFSSSIVAMAADLPRRFVLFLTITLAEKVSGGKDCLNKHQ